MECLQVYPKDTEKNSRIFSQNSSSSIDRELAMNAKIIFLTNLRAHHFQTGLK